MKKIFTSILLALLLPLSAVAQSMFSSGYYRVQNTKSERFLKIVDTRAPINAGTTSVDLTAFQLVRGFSEKVCSDPATICWFEQVSQYKYNIIGQGLNFNSITGIYLDFDPVGTNQYIISATGSYHNVDITKKLYDTNFKKDTIADVQQNGTAQYQYWAVRPVSGNYYYGILPNFQATFGDDNSYFTTLYASFPFKTSSTVKAYYPVEIAGEYVRVKELTSAVPGGAPVIVQCASDKPANNKVDLLTSAASTSGNLLTGVYFCNDVAQSTGHRNVVDYKSATMRVLGRAADGRLAFVTDKSLKYIPANKAYLTVPAGSPATLYVVTELPAGIELQTVDRAPSRRGVFTLSGLRVSDTTEGLAPGVYVVDGKKVVVK